MNRATMKYGTIDVSNLKVGDLSVVAVEHCEISYFRWIQEPGKPRYRGTKPIKRWSDGISSWLADLVVVQLGSQQWLVQLK